MGWGRNSAVSGACDARGACKSPGPSVAAAAPSVLGQHPCLAGGGSTTGGRAPWGARCLAVGLALGR